MKFFPLPLSRDGTQYVLNPITGNLTSTVTSALPSRQLPDKLRNALDLCNNPYLIRPASAKLATTTGSLTPGAPLAHRMVRACRIGFLPGVFYASLGRPSCESARDAIREFRTLIDPLRQDELCFPRALYAARTSAAFRRSGVVFIGAFLPSRAMHSWIIEDGQQPDPDDSVWLNYQPVAALF